MPPRARPHQDVREVVVVTRVAVALLVFVGLKRSDYGDDAEARQRTRPLQERLGLRLSELRQQTEGENEVELTVGCKLLGAAACEVRLREGVSMLERPRAVVDAPALLAGGA